MRTLLALILLSTFSTALAEGGTSQTGGGSASHIGRGRSDGGEVAAPVGNPRR